VFLLLGMYATEHAQIRRRKEIHKDVQNPKRNFFIMITHVMLLHIKKEKLNQ